MRIMVVVDKQPNGTALTASTLFQQIVCFNSPTNILWRKRFVVLRDDFHDFGAVTVDSNVGTEFGHDHYTYNTYIKKLITTDYSTSTDLGVIADLSTNAIYLICYASRYTEGDDEVLPIGGYCRIRYYDF